MDTYITFIIVILTFVQGILVGGIVVDRGMTVVYSEGYNAGIQDGYLLGGRK